MLLQYVYFTVCKLCLSKVIESQRERERESEKAIVAIVKSDDKLEDKD